ncbi:MAG: hypothetical protein EAZ57_06080 [Cytophagales bacterium]|nr:MAG: hypothetical protein EAZ67_08270 [Cytophagales bacterium]TAF60750.1 MAG: hypothetical protein EAZ57_06080 [Cytophagales bacterium]
MSLQIPLKVSPLAELQVLRFCAGMGVSHIALPYHEPLNEQDFRDLQDLTSWLSGPEIVLISDKPITHDFFIVNSQQLSNPSCLAAITQERVCFVECFLTEKEAAIAHISAQNTACELVLKANLEDWLRLPAQNWSVPVWVEFLDKLPEDLISFLAKHKIKGLSLRPEQSSFDFLYDFLPELEV